MNLSVTHACGEKLVSKMFFRISKAAEQKIEAVKRQAAKMLPGFKNLTYPEHLKAFNFATLHYHRL